MKKPSRVDVFKEMVRRIDSSWKGCKEGTKTKNIKFIDQLYDKI